jgi:hypothetical protein
VGAQASRAARAPPGGATTAYEALGADRLIERLVAEGYELT